LRPLLCSTSEIYGDPEVHPQQESYGGHDNCIGPRACYDEGKRISETLCYEYHKLGVSVRIARIFNTCVFYYFLRGRALLSSGTLSLSARRLPNPPHSLPPPSSFGPRMDPDDGRVVSNFIKQALQGKPLTIYGDGAQTRSFQYVSDLVQGLVALMNCESIDADKNDVLPVNLGNPDEYTIKQFAENIRALVNPGVSIVKLPATQDDPKQRKPDITRAGKVLRWRPKTTVDQGLAKAVLYFKHELGLATAADPAPPAIWMPDIVDTLDASYL